MKSLNLLYHRVNKWTPDPWTLCDSPVHFAEQMDVLSRISPRPIVTFDDGYADNLFHALPILERYEIPAKFFIVSGALGRRIEMWWDALEYLFLNVDGQDESAYQDAFNRIRPLRLAQQEEELFELFASRQLSRDASPERRMMTPTELLKLASSPLVEIGAHTVTHPVLSTLDAESQKVEIEGSKRTLEDLLGKSVSGFAYPNGMPDDYSWITSEMVKGAGFSHAYSAFEHNLADPFQMPRVMIRDWDGYKFSSILSKAAENAQVKLKNI